MVESFPPSDETKRLQALQSLKVLDAQPDARFERIIRLARRLFDVPLAAVLLADRGGSAAQHRELLEVFESAHRRAAGNGAAHDVFVVSDTANDPRFRRRAVTLDDRAVRFYAGCAVHASHGARVGTLCLVDTVPRTLAAEELAAARRAWRHDQRGAVLAVDRNERHAHEDREPTRFRAHRIAHLADGEAFAVTAGARAHRPRRFQGHQRFDAVTRPATACSQRSRGTC